MPKDLLFSFVGRAPDGVRWKLFAHNFNRADVFIKELFRLRPLHRGKPETKASAPGGVIGKPPGIRNMRCAHEEVRMSSIRIFEMMEAGIAPVIMSNNWLPPVGPSWEEFALFVPER